MSSRALRRLEKQRGAELLQAGSAGDEDHTEQPVVVRQHKNLFALMGNDSEESEAEDSPAEDSACECTPVAVALPTKSQKKNKKKNQKKQKKAKQHTDDDQQEHDDDEEFNKVLQAYGVDTTETIDTTREYDLDNGDPQLEINVTHAFVDPSFRYFTPRKQVKVAPLLQIDTKDLDPDTEFKKLFGKLSQEAIDDADSTTSTSIPPEQLQQIKRLARVVRGWGGRDRRSIPGTTRKLVLTKIRDDWIPTQKKDMTMEELTTKELVEDRLASTEDWADVIKEDITNELRSGIKYYKFDRGAESKIINSQFYSAVVAAPNHETLMQLLPKFPYHVETILQVALILIRQGDKSNSNGLVERALFAFDRGFKQNFDISSGLSRLPYNYYLNRQFYLAIFRYIEVLTKKGTFFAAFTYAKLLLALSPAEDPLGARYFIDFYALLADQHQWLIDMVDSPLTTTYAHWYTPGLAYSTALAHLSQKDEKKAKDALKKAFVKHPYVGYKLLESIGLASDIPVNDYSIFEVGPETELHTEAYLLRAPMMWKEASHRNFLHDSLLEFINNKVKLEPIAENVQIPDNFLRFTILSGEGKTMSKIPKEIWDDNEIFEFDVLPPKQGNVEKLTDFIDEKFINAVFDEERMLEMAQRLSLQQLVDSGVQMEHDD